MCNYTGPIESYVIKGESNDGTELVGSFEVAENTLSAYAEAYPEDTWTLYAKLETLPAQPKETP